MAPLMVGRVVVVCGLSHAGACCVGVCPPSWWGVVFGPPRGGAWRGGVWLPAGWGVLCWCVAPLMAGRGVVVCDPAHCGACCGGV